MKGPTGKNKLTLCILDAGSQSSFIHSSLLELLELNVTGRKSLEITTFEESYRTAKYRRQVDFDLMGYTTRARVSVAAFESHNTHSAQPTPRRDIRVMASLNKIKLSDPQDDCDDALPIEILIGADYYWKIVTMERSIRVSPTVFRYILFGNKSSTTVDQVSFHYISFTVYEISNESVHHLGI